MQYYIETSGGEIQFIPIYVVNDTKKVKPNILTDFKTYNDTGVRRLSFRRAEDQVLADLHLRVGVDLKMKNVYGPHLVASYRSLNRT